MSEKESGYFVSMTETGLRRPENLYNMNQQEVHDYLLENIKQNAHIVVDRICPNLFTADCVDDNGETNWDRVYREIPGLYKIDPFFANALADVVCESGYMVKPEVYLQTLLEDYISNSDSPFAKIAMNDLDYIYTFNSALAINDFFSKKLDFKNVENFDTTANVIDFIQLLLCVGVEAGTWSRTFNYLTSYLNEVLASSDGSYLLQIKTSELLNRIQDYMDHGISPIDEEFLRRDKRTYVMSPSIKRNVSMEFEFNIDDLSQIEQQYFLDFIKVKPVDEIESVKNFVGKYGKSGFRTFLSLQHKSELGDKLISFGNEVEPVLAQSLFDKYGEIVDVSGQVLEYLDKEFGDKGEFSQEIVSEISDKLLREGSQLLERTINKVGSVTTVDELDDIKYSLEAIKADTLAFLSAFKTLKSAKSEFSLEDVKNIVLSTVPITDLKPDDIEIMKNMYMSNYSQYPELAKYLTNKFESATKQPGGTISVLRRNGEIVAFYRLGVTAQDGVLYFGSFNVDPTYQGASLGETLMQESLDVKAQDSIITADCNPQVSVSANYIERGFIATKKTHLEEIDLLSIVRNEKLNKELVSRGMTSEEIINNGIQRDGISIRSVPMRDLPIYSFDFVGEEKGDKVTILTRYIKDKKRGMIYFVTEEVTKDFLDRYSSPK